MRAINRPTLGVLRQIPRTALALLCFTVLAACSGNAVVTLTATPSTDGFLAYRVTLTDAKLQSTGGSTLQVLQKPLTVDFTSLFDVSEVLGAAGVKKGSYSSVVLTLDYTNAQIIYDDGTANGVSLSPVDASGKALGPLIMTLNLDNSDIFKVSATRGSRLSLAFKLAASGNVNLSAHTITVNPLLVASAASIDARQVRIRGTLKSFNASSGVFAANITPFDAPDISGALSVTTDSSTGFEINGTGSTGAATVNALAAGAPLIAYGTFSSTSVSNNTTTTVSTGTNTSTTVDTASQDISFVAAQVVAGIGVKQAGLDRVSGVVAARTANTVFLEDATLLARDGTSTLLTGTTSLNLGVGTRVTLFGQGTATLYTIQQVSVGSSVDAIGLATVGNNGDAIFDATQGRVRVGPTDAGGQVVSVDTGGLTVSLWSLGNRRVTPYNFDGTGAQPANYLIKTTNLDLSNVSASSEVTLQGYVTELGFEPPDFTAVSLQDPTTLNAVLSVDWGAAGSTSPFVSYSSASMDLDAHNSALGQHHHVQLGAAPIDISTLSADVMLMPGLSGNTVYSIGHASTHTVENFESYSTFIAQLQAELSPNEPALSLSAEGAYDASSTTLTANNISVLLAN